MCKYTGSSNCLTIETVDYNSIVSRLFIDFIFNWIITRNIAEFCTASGFLWRLIFKWGQKCGKLIFPIWNSTKSFKQFLTWNCSNPTFKAYIFFQNNYKDFLYLNLLLIDHVQVVIINSTVCYFCVFLQFTIYKYSLLNRTHYGFLFLSPCFLGFFKIFDVILT